MKQNISVCFAHNLMKNYHMIIEFNVLNVCGGITIDVRIMLAKNFWVQFLSCLIFFDIALHTYAPSPGQNGH